MIFVYYFLLTSSIINLYKKLLSYIFNKIINLISKNVIIWTKLLMY